WQKAYGGRTQGAFSVLGSVTKTRDGGFVLAGYTSGFGAGLNDGWVFKMDETGNVQWARTFGGRGYDAVGSVEQASDGGFIVSGYLQPNPIVSASTDAFVLKLDPSGNIPNCHIMGLSSPVVTGTNATTTTTTAPGTDISSIMTLTNATVTPTSAVSRVLCFRPKDVQIPPPPTNNSALASPLSEQIHATNVQAVAEAADASSVGVFF